MGPPTGCIDGKVALLRDLDMKPLGSETLAECRRLAAGPGFAFDGRSSGIIGLGRGAPRRG